MKKLISLTIIFGTLFLFGGKIIYGATPFFANDSLTQNGIEWCEEIRPLYELLGEKDWLEHHKHSIESRVCANLYKDPIWLETGPDRISKLIEKSQYFVQLERAESFQEAESGIIDTSPVEIPIKEKFDPEKELEETEKIETEIVEPQEDKKIPDSNISLSEDSESQVDGDGGCLIATATFGTELSTQVQKLRELRESVIIKTDSGNFFMKNFYQIYYIFSPSIADLERENIIFKEIVKITITPLLITLTILDLIDIDSEFEMVVTGIGIISLNFVLYFVTPVLIITYLKGKLKNIIKLQ